MWTRELSVALVLALVIGVSTAVVTSAAVHPEGTHGVLGGPAVSGPLSGLAPDNAPVSAHLSVTPTLIDAGESIQFQTSASGGTPPYAYDYFGLPNGCPQSNSPSFSCDPSQSGAFSIYVNVTDSNGNATNSNSVSLTVDPSISASLTINPGTITESQSVTVQVTPNGGSNSYSYAYFGLPSGCQSESGANFVCTPSQTGSFSVYVNVTDTNGGFFVTPTQHLQVNPSNNGNNGSGGNGNNSSNPLSGLLSGFSGFFSLLIVVGIIGFVTWILLIVGVWIIAVILIRRLPKRGALVAAAASATTAKCSSCSASIPGGTKFCPECGASTAPKKP